MTKKFYYTRKTLAEELERILDKLESIDPTMTAPYDVVDELESIKEELHSLSDNLNDSYEE